jgi:hypothetical protein
MGITTLSVNVGYVDVDIELDDIDEDGLIQEIEERGYVVLHSDDPRLDQLIFTDEEILILKKLIDDANPKIGSVMYNLREKFI